MLLGNLKDKTTEFFSVATTSTVRVLPSLGIGPATKPFQQYATPKLPHGSNQKNTGVNFTSNILLDKLRVGPLLVSNNIP